MKKINDAQPLRKELTCLLSVFSNKKKSELNAYFMFAEIKGGALVFFFVEVKTNMSLFNYERGNRLIAFHKDNYINKIIFKEKRLTY